MGFEEYVASRGPALARFARVLAGEASLGEDLLQAALADAYRHWARVEAANHPDAYLRRMILNRYLGWRRLRARDEVLVPDPQPYLAAASDPAVAIVEADALRRAAAGLPRRARAVLVLRYYLDLDDAEIADLLQMAPGTVRSTASRALRVLREQLSEPVRPEPVLPRRSRRTP